MASGWPHPSEIEGCGLPGFFQFYANGIYLTELLPWQPHGTAVLQHGATFKSLPVATARSRKSTAVSYSSKLSTRHNYTLQHNKLQSSPTSLAVLLRLARASGVVGTGSSRIPVYALSAGIWASPDGEDLFHWNARIQGLGGTVWEGKILASHTLQIIIMACCPCIVMP